MKHRYIDKSFRRLRRRRDDPDKTRAYAPGELQRLAHEKANNVGVLRPDTGDLTLPSGLDDIGEGQQAGHPAGVVIVIVMIALIWIAIITFFISRMPDPKEPGESPKAEQNLIDDGRSKSEASR